MSATPTWALVACGLLAACGHPSKERSVLVENRVTERAPPDATLPAEEPEYDEGGDGCSYTCWVRLCEEEQETAEIDAGTSCDEQCIAMHVAEGMDEGRAASDCLEDCVCGE